MSLKDRLSALRQHLGLSQKAMAAELGIDEKTWQRGELGKTEPGAETLRRLTEMGFNANWILTGAGTMRADHIPAASGFHEAGAQSTPASLEAAGFVMIPRYGFENSTQGNADGFLTRLALPMDWITRKLRTTPDALRFIEANGDGMSPVIADGDLLLLDASEPKFRGAGVYALLVDGALIVKRLGIKLDGSLVVSSDNPAYKPEELPRWSVEDLNIVGRVRPLLGQI